MRHLIRFVVILIIYFTSNLYSQDMIWKRIYDSGSSDFGYDVCVDSSGNIIVTGSSYGYVNNYSDFLTIKYNNDGDTIWTKRFHNSTADYPYGIATDPWGNIIVIGCTFTDSTGRDYCTIKYSPLGDILWIRTYTSDSARPDEAYAVAIDSKGSVIVTGIFYYKESSIDYLTIKYDSSGEILWARTYDYNSYNKATAITVDYADNIYVTGYSADSIGVYDWCTIKYSKDGDIVWIKREDSYYDDGKPSSITIDKSSGDVLVCGYLYPWDLLKYDSDSGDVIWKKGYVNQGSIHDITTDENGCIYLANWHEISPPGGGFFHTIKCDSLGDTLWTVSCQEGYTTQAMGICLDKYGNVIVAGTCHENPIIDNANYLTIKYSSITGIINEEISRTINKYRLSQNYPNPFNPSTEVSFVIDHSSFVTLKVYDVLGREIAVLIKEKKQAGEYNITWNAEGKPSGVYFYRLFAGNYIETKKMVLMK